MSFPPKPGNSVEAALSPRSVGGPISNDCASKAVIGQKHMEDDGEQLLKHEQDTLRYPFSNFEWKLRLTFCFCNFPAPRSGYCSGLPENHRCQIQPKSYKPPSQFGKWGSLIRAWGRGPCHGAFSAKSSHYYPCWCCSPVCMHS